MYNGISSSGSAAHNSNAAICCLCCGGLILAAGVITMLVTGIIGLNGGLSMNPIGARVMVSISSILLFGAIVGVVKACLGSR